MKKSLLLLYITLFSFNNLTGQNYYMSAPEGYAVGTTGGTPSIAVTCSTHAQLKSNLRNTSKKIILVSGTIDFSSLGRISEVIKDKTIIGLPGAKFVSTVRAQAGSGILNFKSGSRNIIIRNIIFQGPGAYDVNGSDNLSIEGGRKIWIDHREFRDGMDGNLDIKDNTDSISISWCKFIYTIAPIAAGPGGDSDDHRFSNLIGSDPSNQPTDGRFSITFQNCYWAEGCKGRMPRVRNSELHILNCYYNTSVSGAIGLGLEGGVNGTTCYVENTNFAKIAKVYQSYESAALNHSLTYSGSLAPPTKTLTNVGSAVSAPTYSYTVMPVADVATAIPHATCGAGATLQVTSGGVISSSCTTTGIISAKEAHSTFVIYPNPTTGSFNIQGKEDIKTLSIMNLIGNEVYSTDNIPNGNDVMIDANLEEGVYIIKIQYSSGASGVQRLIRSK